MVLTAKEISEVEPTPENLESFFPVQLIGPTWLRDESGEFILPERTLGWHVLAWIDENITAIDGDGPFKPTPEQTRFILWFYALDADNRFSYRTAVLQRCKGWGKDPMAAVLCIVELVGPCVYWKTVDGFDLGKPNPVATVGLGAVSKDQPLALDTMVRTTGGWKTLGDIHVGDYVFDEHGHAQKVMRETEILSGLDCYEVEFQDGQKVVASAEHGWTVTMSDKHSGKPVYQTVTTEAIFQAINAKRRRAVSVASAPVFLPERKDLLVDPYYLGLWLGDGMARNSGITVGVEDYMSIWSELHKLLLPGEHISQSGSFDRTGAVVLSIVCDKKPGNGKVISTYQKLKALGLICNKHVPERYLQGSFEQRLSLLQGMVDSDGHCVDGCVSFTNTNKSLIDSFVELAQSLGFVAYSRQRTDGAFIAQFRNTEGLEVARVPRKLQQCWYKGKKRSVRYVKSVKKVPSVPVKCIGIDTESHLFQVENGVLTHNTRNTRDMFQQIVPKRTRDKYRMDIQKENIYVTGTAQRLYTFGTNARSMEGVRLTFFIANETQHWVDGNGGPLFYNTVTGNLAKVPDPRMGRMLCITNAYNPGENSQAERTREAEQKVWDGLAEESGILYDSVEAHPNVPMTAAWAPLVIDQIKGDAHWLTWENIKGEVLRGDLPVSRKRRMWYNQVVSDEESLFDLRDIETATVKELEGSVHDLKPGDEITLGFDGGRTDDSTALVAYRPADKLLVPIAVWQKPDTADYWVIDADRVDSVVHWVFDRFRVQAFYADVALWESYINSWSDEYREQLTLKATAHSAVGFDMRGHRKKVAQNNESFVSEVRDGSIHLNGDPILRQHMLNAEARYDGFGLKFGKKGGRESPKKIDVLIAGTLAYMAGRDLAERAKKPERRYSRRLVQG